MPTPTYVQDGQDETSAFHQWCFQETVEIEHRKQSLEEQQQELKQQQRELEREKKDFYRQKEAEEKAKAQEERLFDMKLKILEEELQKLASEKKHIERQKEFYQRVNQFNQQQSDTTSHKQRAVSTSVGSGELFFCGVANAKALKKRYKDLIKIYHPDNLDGDTGTIQEINRIYDRLRSKFAE